MKLSSLPAITSLLAPSLLGPCVAQEVAGTYSVDRYSVLWQQSVFAGKTDRGELINFKAEEWALVGVFTFDKGEGAVIVNRKSGSVEQVEQGMANRSGLKLISVLPADGEQPQRARIEFGDKEYLVRKKDQ